MADKNRQHRVVNRRRSPVSLCMNIYMSPCTHVPIREQTQLNESLKSVGSDGDTPKVSAMPPEVPAIRSQTLRKVSPTRVADAFGDTSELFSDTSDNVGHTPGSV